ncbi:hypothetical protein GOBAR_AA10474 [Gossypium barbadense]|uniref:AAA+ ATPase domain-containing protein n=1 Tax=Gossypium barbadense TaxID=3634 RepID=A0A2P5Y3M1_GOSBA|nr:hypothetical protein GOBAR_AA10474 [Gossypium barbadense]
MRAAVRSVRNIRSAFPQPMKSYSSAFLRKPSHLIEINSTSVYRLPDNAEIHRFLFPAFFILTPFSTDASSKVDITEVNRGGPLVEYERRIEAGELFDGDACQVGTLRELQRLYDEIVESAAACRLDRYAVHEKPVRSRWFWSRLMPQSSYSPVKGLYLYGGVGTGKTMLMDLFFDQLPCNWRKKRIHFHDFMLDVHSRLQRHRGVADPLEVVAGEISDDAILLCLDEFMVTDVADALILNRLFGHLFSNGVERCVVHEIGSAVDYRKLTSVPLGANGCAYFSFEELCDRPLGAADYFGLFKNFHTLALEGVPKFGLHNRTAAYRFVTLVDVMYENKARLLCAAEGAPLELFENIVTVSDAQYMAPRTSSSLKLSYSDSDAQAEEGFYFIGKDLSSLLKTTFQQLIGEHVASPQVVEVVMGRTLQVMYENKARLLCTAEGTPLELFENIVTASDAQHMAPRTSSRSRRNDDSNLCVDNELGFTKDRTISRLTEMNSKEYLEQHAEERQLSQQFPKADAAQV